MGGKAKHTPGPWRLASWGNGRQELPILRSDGKEIGCLRGEGSLKDGRLMAVAPDLAEALALCRDALRDHEQYEDDHESSLEGEAYRAAVAALKKAGVD